MDKLDEYEVSHDSLLREADELQEWESAMLNASVREKCCMCINLYNNVPVQPLSLVTKESRGWLRKLSSKCRDSAFSLHRLIMVVYAPAVLSSTQGTLSLRLQQQDSLQSLDVVLNHPVSQAATFVCRWPRAVPTSGKGLAFLASTEGVKTRTGSLVGVIHPFWEDKLSTKMVFERQLPVLCYPLEEQDPSIYVKDVSQLRTAMLTWIHAGHAGSDVGQRRIGQLRDSASFRKASPSYIGSTPPPPPLVSTQGVTVTATPTIGANAVNICVAAVAPRGSAHTTQVAPQHQSKKQPGRVNQFQAGVVRDAPPLTKVKTGASSSEHFSTRAAGGAAPES